MPVIDKVKQSVRQLKSRALMGNFQALFFAGLLFG